MSWNPVDAARATAIAVGVAAVVSLLVYVLVRSLATRDELWALVRRRAVLPFTLVLVLLAVLVARPETGATASTAALVRQVVALLLIAAGAWLLAQLAFVAEDAALRHYDVDVPNNERVRRVRTQVMVIRRFVVSLTVVAAFAAMLMTFESVRAVGASLLASAGVVGIVAGLAAQTTLANVFAGLQLAFSDQLRIDDIVVVEQEWGRVELLTLTYVVVRCWDERRLVLPTTYFTEKPVENWTRTDSRVVGAVLLHVDYALPVEPVRAELSRLVERSPLWDGRECKLQVVDVTDTTMVLRALVSAADATNAFDLRCEVREKLLEFVSSRYPDALPRVRTDAVQDGGLPGRG